MANHDATLALPASGNTDKALMRTMLVSRFLYFIPASEDPTQFVPTEIGGGITQVLGYNGKFFWYDAADASTAHDGVTTIVAAGGQRYKVNGVDAIVRRVLDKDLDTPPVDPAMGDAYIVAVAAIGAWAGHDGEIAVWTARGWEFIDPTRGWIVQVADEDAPYRRNESGSWVVFGVPAANSIASSQLIGARTHWVVENQTTNTPPSAAQGTAYIIGSAPTDAWLGHVGKLAVREVSVPTNEYKIISPGEGWQAYDKAQNINVIYNGTTWASAAGAIIYFDETYTEGNGSVTTPGGGTYTWSDTTPPTTSNIHSADGVGITRSVQVAGAKLRIRYRARGTSSGGQFVAALFRDSDTNALKWNLSASAATDAEIDTEFIITVPDTNEHTYKVLLIGTNIGARPSSLSHRQITLEEFAA
jgi:hypothetical protein